MDEYHKGFCDHNFDILKGEWIRPDGGYVLKINKINEDGFVNAEVSPAIISQLNIVRKEGVATWIFLSR